MKILYFILLIMSAVFYPLFKDDLSFILLLTLLIFPIVMFVLVTLSAKSIRIKVYDFPEQIIRGEKLSFRINIKNKLFVPVSNCVITVLYRTCGSGYEKYIITVPIKAHSSENVAVNIKAVHCGKVECIIKKAVVYDLIGLFSHRIKLDIAANAVIMPREYPLGVSADTFSESKDQSSIYNIGGSGDPTEISGFHDYRDGDSMKFIHWKLSSRTSSFIVKEFSAPKDEHILIIPDICVSDNMEQNDLAADVYFSVLKFIAVLGISVSVLENDEELSFSEVKDADEAYGLVRDHIAKYFYKDVKLPVSGMSLSARFSEKVFYEKYEHYSHVIIVTSRKERSVFSEIEQSGAGEIITVLNSGEKGSASEDKNSDVIVYDVNNNGKIEIPENIIL